jgi:hypothetical protein
MCIVPPLDRLASASVVLFGQHGDISAHAQQRGISRQRLYRQADSVVRDLEGRQQQRQLACLHQQVTDLQVGLSHLQAAQRYAVVVTSDRQAEFAGVALA